MFCKSFIKSKLLISSNNYNLLNNKIKVKTLKVRVNSFSSQISRQTADKPEFPGSRSKWTETLEFINPESFEGIPVYRVMDRNGIIINSSQDPHLSQTMVTRIYKGLVVLYKFLI
jgi:hypothetical protein